MEKTTSKKSNNKGVFLFLFLVALIFGSIFFYLKGNMNTDFKMKSNQIEKPSSKPSYSIDKKEVIKDYCSLTRGETSSYVVRESPFSLGSSGTVSFFSSSRISLYGNGRTLYGTWTVSSNNGVRVNDLRVVSGNFDASNNYGINGTLFIGCDGSLSGNLYDRNRNKTSLVLRK